MNRVIYSFWFGPEITPNRIRCLHSLKNVSGVNTILVTDKNLKEYENGENPIHEGFNYLSATHKADYLRSYFMYHYGGGYSDIKECDFNWNPYFDILENSHKSFIGYPELSVWDIAYEPASSFYKMLVGNGAYIFKPKTEFAKLWMDETNRFLDSVIDDLKHNSGEYHPRAVKGGIHENHYNEFLDSKYPIEWNQLLGRIFHRLQFENLNSFIIGMPRINMSNYR